MLRAAGTQQLLQLAAAEKLTFVDRHLLIFGTVLRFVFKRYVHPLITVTRGIYCSAVCVAGGGESVSYQ